MNQRPYHLPSPSQKAQPLLPHLETGYRAISSSAAWPPKSAWQPSGRCAETARTARRRHHNRKKGTRAVLADPTSSAPCSEFIPATWTSPRRLARRMASQQTKRPPREGGDRVAMVLLLVETFLNVYNSWRYGFYVCTMRRWDSLAGGVWARVRLHHLSRFCM